MLYLCKEYSKNTFMLIKNLKLKNIGPFKEEELDFAYEKTEPHNPPVTIITGLNGAGKSIIIDALRTALSGQKIERDIVANPSDFSISVDLNIGDGFHELSTSTLENGAITYIDWSIAKVLGFRYEREDTIFPWIVDYWSSKMPSDSFVINNMTRMNHEAFMLNVMTGKKHNVDLTNFLCNLDYMRGSEVPAEKETAETLFHLIRNLIDQCLDNGKFLHIRRQDLMPVFLQNGQEVTLDKLSSGNIFLIEHLILLISKMYSLSMLLNSPTEDILQTPGLLLIDEIETHLHPRWQKSILPIIRSTFPNLQIILTTHSPFVLSSLPGAKIFTCKPQAGYSTIIDETSAFSTMPVDQILQSDAFNVEPFNNDISQLIESRKNAIFEGRKKDAELIESQLIDINPLYFSYLDDKNIDDLLEKVNNGTVTQKGGKE